MINNHSINDIKIDIVNLSDKKIRLDYFAPIICKENIIDMVEMKVRYKVDSTGSYIMYYPKPIFLNNISNKFRVKKKYIHYGTILFGSNIVNNFSIDGKVFNNLIKSVYITDEEWYREWNRENQLRKLFNK